VGGLERQPCAFGRPFFTHRLRYRASPCQLAKANGAGEPGAARPGRPYRSTLLPFTKTSIAVPSTFTTRGTQPVGTSQATDRRPLEVLPGGGRVVRFAFSALRAISYPVEVYPAPAGGRSPPARAAPVVRQCAAGDVDLDPDLSILERRQLADDLVPLECRLTLSFSVADPPCFRPRGAGKPLELAPVESAGSWKLSPNTILAVQAAVYLMVDVLYAGSGQPGGRRVPSAGPAPYLDDGLCRFLRSNTGHRQGEQGRALLRGILRSYI